jgi:DNA-binding PadR family transcriptional regulator
MALTSKEELIIDILGDQEMYGLDIVERSGGSLKRGVVYVTLSDMERQGLVEGRTTPRHSWPTPNRRSYRVTEKGRNEFLRRHIDLPQAVVVSE